VLSVKYDISKMGVRNQLEKKMKIVMRFFIGVSFVAISACGGSGGGSNSDPTDPSLAEKGSISGSVAGTTIIAVNESGNILAIADTAGRERDFDSDGNGTLDAFSFVLNEIPLSEEIRVFLVTGGGIYPMYFDTDNDGVPDSNVFTMESGSTNQIVLDFIDIDVEQGRAIPQLSPTDDSTVTGAGVVIPIPLSINEPPTSGLSVVELNARGKNALASGWVLGAKNYYQAAVNISGNGSGNDDDTARFMLALTRVAALGFDTLSDGDAQDMGRLGDLLDLFGVANGDSRANWDLLELPESVPSDSPTGNDVRDFTYDVVMPELQAAAENFDDVTNSFDTVFVNDGEAINADHGDALFLSGLLRSVMTTLAILRAYDLDVDIDDILNESRTAEYVQTEYKSIPGMPDTTKYIEAKSSLTIALARMKLAIDSIEAETDDQSDDFITIDATVDTVEIKTWIDEAQSSMDGVPMIAGIDKVAVDLQAFFNNGIILDDTTLPRFEANHIDPADGFFDEPTFGGVILDTDTSLTGIQDINKDENGDGIADILQ
jgi:hypothetical protein